MRTSDEGKGMDWKEGRKDGRKKGRKEERKEGRKEKRKEGRMVRRKEGRKDGQTITGTSLDRRLIALHTNSGHSAIADLRASREAFSVTMPPNSHVLFSAPAVIPCLSSLLPVGMHWLVTWVDANPERPMAPYDDIYFDDEQYRLFLGKTGIQIV